jgi:hypothetical protein
MGCLNPGVDVKARCVIEARYRCVDMIEQIFLHVEKEEQDSKGRAQDPSRFLHLSSEQQRRNESLPKRGVAVSRALPLLCTGHSWACADDDSDRVVVVVAEKKSVCRWLRMATMPGAPNPSNWAPLHNTTESTTMSKAATVPDKLKQIVI